MSTSQVIKLYFIALILKKTAKFHTFVEQQRYEEKVAQEKSAKSCKNKCNFEKKAKVRLRNKLLPHRFIDTTDPTRIEKKKRFTTRHWTSN